MGEESIYDLLPAVRQPEAKNPRLVLILKQQNCYFISSDFLNYYDITICHIFQWFSRVNVQSLTNKIRQSINSHCRYKSVFNETAKAEYKSHKQASKTMVSSAIRSQKIFYGSSLSGNAESRDKLCFVLNFFSIRVIKFVIKI